MHRMDRILFSSSSFKSPILIYLLLFFIFTNPNPNVDGYGKIDGDGNVIFPLSSTADDFVADDGSNKLLLFNHQDYSPPAPPPPPPHAPSVSCSDDLGGVGSLDTTCRIVSDVNLTRDVYVEGRGNLYIHPGVVLRCAYVGCCITVNISGEFTLSKNASVVAGLFDLEAFNATFANGSVVNTTGMAGSPPPQTSGTPQGLEGGGGGHGGRGACCLVDDKKLPEDVWGGDPYAWSTLQKPESFGSQGGSTSKEIDYGGGGGGRVKLFIENYVVVDGLVLAEGGDGGTKGGGGSGGSIYIKAHKM